jgi:hypothetical protein
VLRQEFACYGFDIWGLELRALGFLFLSANLSDNPLSLSNNRLKFGPSGDLSIIRGLMQHFGSLLKIKMKCRTTFSALCLPLIVMALKLLHLCLYNLSVEMWRPKSKNYLDSLLLYRLRS